jgi:hypothetical protein
MNQHCLAELLLSQIALQDKCRYDDFRTAINSPSVSSVLAPSALTVHPPGTQGQL